MALLPSGYTVCDGVEGQYDSGVVSASDLEINALFWVQSSPTQTCWFFGSRNTNSTSSAGQLNFDYTSSGDNYFGCASGRVSLSNFTLPTTRIFHIYVLNNYIEVSSNQYVWSATGSATTFTGTRNMYICALNNAGTISTTGKPDEVFGFIIKKNGTLLKDFVPCFRESDSTYGLYELVSDSFVTGLTMTSSKQHKRFRVSSSGGGKAFIKSIHGERVDEMLATKMYIPVDDPFTTVAKVDCGVEPDDGYYFKNWTVNGNVVSIDGEFTYHDDDDADLVANFEKKSIDLKINHRLVVLPNTEYGSPGNLSVIYDLEVLSGSVHDDTIQKTTSTFEVKEIPSGVHTGQFAVLRSPRGERLYVGRINSIDGNTITCREALSFFDQDYLVKTSTISSACTVRYGAERLIQEGKYSRNFSDSDKFLSHMASRIWMDVVNWYNQPIYENLSIYEDRNSVVRFPKVTETGAQNLEDLLHSVMGFGIYVKVTNYNNIYIMFEVRYYKNNETLVIGDNMDNIADINVVVESQENTVVNIFNSTGASLTGMYGVMSDGSIGRYDTSSTGLDSYLANTNYHGSVVMSDDDLNTILAENLSSSFLNHKITFSVVFNNMLTFERLAIGTPVNFYVGGRLYKSVITAVQYDIPANTGDISGAVITLGNVRTNLTSKLNLKK